MTAIAADLVHHAEQVHYAQVRPMREVTRYQSERQLTGALAAGHTLTMDCSEAVTLVCKLAGLQDPNGHHFDGTGYTGTMLTHLPHYNDPRSAYPGALVVWGDWPGEHVAMVTARNGDNPWLFSHGSEIGPLHVALHTEDEVHAGQPRTFLAVSGL